MAIIDSQTNSRRYCDFCGDRLNGKGFSSDNDRDRDVCHKCVKEMASQINFKPSKKTTTMGKITQLAKTLLDKDTKTLIKAGFVDKSLEVTEEGQAELNAITFLANKEALVKAAEEKLKEEKEDK